MDKVYNMVTKLSGLSVFYVRLSVVYEFCMRVWVLKEGSERVMNINSLYIVFLCHFMVGIQHVISKKWIYAFIKENGTKAMRRCTAGDFY